MVVPVVDELLVPDAVSDVHVINPLSDVVLLEVGYSFFRGFFEGIFPGPSKSQGPEQGTA